MEKDYYADINGCRGETFYGQGKSLVLMEADNRDLELSMRLGRPMWSIVTQRQGEKLKLQLHADFTGDATSVLLLQF